ncbi:IS66 family insertion sequence element accessory protein TnpA [Salinispira pacifica]|uniref:Transposase n=1 Tax=Salinispira pacifica TaxID=1307761 RepID=V5WG40_9SPIO|nr:hypothetical protein [Salinispira pacifica]AHC14432.1 hypothetical protein L21SP2_1014 [Salinispira pacifica]AHC14504.1 hypothetical protein L21SP2_1099 [Salinispira pacifica]AHC16553.1 hypothetical protein L21SP2_3213 [Salinispira pacifica]AHC16622.1 hypothetical protein L21SP2_3282 [Salinispira pacifica]
MDKKVEKWKAITDQWRESGQTQKEFCRNHEIKLSTLHYWMKRVKNSMTSESPNRDLVHIEPKGRMASSNDIVIEIDRRFRIMVPDRISSERLQAVLAAFR